MSVYIKNTTGSTKTYNSKDILAGAYRLVEEGRELEWYYDSLLLADIGSGDAVVAKDDSGSSDILDISKAITYLRGNEIVLGEKKSPVTSRLEVQTRRPEGSSSTKVSYDWCDKTTWYQGSTEVTSETMTDSGDGLTFNSANTHWIDLTHGKIYGEDTLADRKIPKIYDNAVEVTSGYAINYTTGDVTFNSAPTGPVTCDYWYASSSVWSLIPDAGKTLFIEHAELNFSKDVMINSPFSFEIWVYNPYDLPNKVPYQKIKYNNIKDVINAANLGQGYIPKIAGLQNDVLVFPFNYATVKPLASSLGTELRVSIDNDVELTGEWATATFYVLSEDE